MDTSTESPVVATTYCSDGTALVTYPAGAISHPIVTSELRMLKEQMGYTHVVAQGALGISKEFCTLARGA